MKIFLAVLSWFLVSSATAATVEMHLPQRAGGLASTLGALVSQGLKSRGWDVDFKLLGNCGAIKQRINDNKLLLTVWENEFQVSDRHTCYIDETNQDFVAITWINHWYLCSNKADKLEKGKTYTVALRPSAPDDWLLSEIGTRLGISLNPVEYTNTGAVRRAVINKETDLYWDAAGLEMHTAGQSTCWYSTLPATRAGIKPLKSLISHPSTTKSTVGYYMTNKNWPQDLRNKLQKDIEEIVSSKEYQNILEQKKFVYPTVDKNLHKKTLDDSVRSLNK